MPGLWKNNPETPEGKYLVQRRDGSIPEWPYFVLGANDPAAAGALLAYANIAEDCGFDPVYIQEVRQMAYEWNALAVCGQPDAPPDLTDDPDIIEKMKEGRSA